MKVDRKDASKIFSEAINKAIKEDLGQERAKDDDFNEFRLLLGFMYVFDNKPDEASDAFGTKGKNIEDIYKCDYDDEYRAYILLGEGMLKLNTARQSSNPENMLFSLTANYIKSCFELCYKEFNVHGDESPKTDTERIISCGEKKYVEKISLPYVVYMCGSCTHIQLNKMGQKWEGENATLFGDVLNWYYMTRDILICDEEMSIPNVRVINLFDSVENNKYLKDIFDNNVSSINSYVCDKIESLVKFPNLYNDVGNALVRQIDKLKENEHQCAIVYNYCLAILVAMHFSNQNFAFPLNGIGNLLRKTGEYGLAMRYYRKAIEINDFFAYPYNYLGDCYLELGQYHEAYTCYINARRIMPNNCFPINGLGILCYELGKRFNPDKYYPLAIKYFSLASEADPLFAYAPLFWGRTLARRGNVIDLIEAADKFKVALSLFKYRKFRKQEIGEYLKNIKKTLLLIENDDSVKKNHELKKMINQLMCDKKIAEMIASIDSEEEAGLTEIPISKTHLTSNTGVSNVVRKTIIQGVDRGVFTNSKAFQDFLCEKVSVYPESRNIISIEVLRRWNSFTPLVADSKGGGYFLSLNNIGFVIDPGFDFIDNFRSAGHKFHEIDSVIISHAHDDHTAEFESIMNLTYRYNKLLYEDFIPGRIAKLYNVSKNYLNSIVKKGVETTSFETANIIEYFTKQYQSRRHRQTVIMPSSVEEKFRYVLSQNMTHIDNLNLVCSNDWIKMKKYLDLFESNYSGKHLINSIEDPRQVVKENDNRWESTINSTSIINKITYPTNIDFIALSKDYSVLVADENQCKNNSFAVQSSLPNDDEVLIFPLHAKHEPLSDVSVGFLIKPANKSHCIIYTGDTGWVEPGITTGSHDDVVQIGEQYSMLFSDIYLKTRDTKGKTVLIAHLGGFRDSEHEYIEHYDNIQTYYKNHLGRLGVARLIDVLKPDICILSEFGEEFKGLRADLSIILNEEFSTPVIPADIGLRVQISNNNDIVVKAIRKIDKRFKWIEYDYININEIAYIEIPSLDCIAYYWCPPDVKLAVKPNDVVEAMTNEYEIMQFIENDCYTNVSSELDHCNNSFPDWWLYYSLMNHLESGFDNFNTVMVNV